MFSLYFSGVPDEKWIFQENSNRTKLFTTQVEMKSELNLNGSTQLVVQNPGNQELKSETIFLNYKV